jgi:hypothetical protein
MPLAAKATMMSASVFSATGTKPPHDELQRDASWIAGHAGAALFHHFVLRNGVLR